MARDLVDFYDHQTHQRVLLWTTLRSSMFLGKTFEYLLFVHALIFLLATWQSHNDPGTPCLGGLSSDITIRRDTIYGGHAASYLRAEFAANLTMLPNLEFYIKRSSTDICDTPRPDGDGQREEIVREISVISFCSVDVEEKRRLTAYQQDPEEKKRLRPNGGPPGEYILGVLSCPRRIAHGQQIRTRPSSSFCPSCMLVTRRHCPECGRYGARDAEERECTFRL
ncbi:hypothetical protein BDZ89DRAFT_1039030 [Hymenopellis radicata]|nr:hypothetical protein BDZ89DRAFT_1039030 [Hymenopellis radicata]